MERVVRQGDSLSPSLFFLAIEWLACALRQNAFKGISVGETKVKVSLFAYDTRIFLKGMTHLTTYLNYYSRVLL